MSLQAPLPNADQISTSPARNGGRLAFAVPAISTAEAQHRRDLADDFDLQAMTVAARVKQGTLGRLVTTQSAFCGNGR